MKTTKNSKPTIARHVLIVTAAILLVVCGNQAKATKRQSQLNDTARRTVVLIKADGFHGTDSMDYVINGKKSTHDEFEKIKYSDIMGVNWVSAKNAAKIFDNNDSGHSLLFVTTNHSDEGQKMLAKVNTVENSKGQVFSEDLSGVYAMAEGKFIKLKPDDSNVVTVADYYKAAADQPAIFQTGNDNHAIVASGRNAKTYSTGSSNSKTRISGHGKLYRTTTGQGDVFMLADNEREAASELDNLKDKLIIIDDKEATAADLKKVSAFDIDKMSFKNDDYTRYQYGDKAKNGVVYICTKKAKK